MATVVRPALARGAVVISDRYVDSSLAYQGAGRTLPVDEISWLSSWATGGLKPDLVVLLDIDPTRRAWPGSAPRGGGADRLESESLAFHERVRYAFLDLAAADPKRYLVLDATRPADEIAVVGGSAVLSAGDVHPPASPPTRRIPTDDRAVRRAADADPSAPARTPGPVCRTPPPASSPGRPPRRDAGAAGGVDAAATDGERPRPRSPTADAAGRRRPWTRTPDEPPTRRRGRLGRRWSSSAAALARELP